jgi:REP element-mobilizing transposase RayT
LANINFENHPQFFTATILQWQHLLADDTYKDIIIQSLLYLKNEGSIKVYAFVIMPNHIHLVWQIQDGYKQATVQQRLMKFTAQQFKFKLTDTGSPYLASYLVNAADRKYQFWERNPLSTGLWTPAVLTQKLDYIHNNPLQPKWQLTDYPENYKYSSAGFYHTGHDAFGMLTHYNG